MFVYGVHNLQEQQGRSIARVEFVSIEINVGMSTNKAPLSSSSSSFFNLPEDTRILVVPEVSTMMIKY